MSINYFNESLLNTTTFLLKENSLNYTTVESCKAVFNGVVFANYVLAGFCIFLIIFIVVLLFKRGLVEWRRS